MFMTFFDALQSSKYLYENEQFWKMTYEKLSFKSKKQTFQKKKLSSFQQGTNITAFFLFFKLIELIIGWWAVEKSAEKFLPLQSSWRKIPMGKSK
jgi:hypothetical protein